MLYFQVVTQNQPITLLLMDHSIDFNIIQLNHYKCKTFPEFKYIKTRQRLDIRVNIEESFHAYNINEVEDLTAFNFYTKMYS
jgi:hypothetical protein